MDQGDSSGCGKSQDSEYVMKLEWTDFADGLNVKQKIAKNDSKERGLTARMEVPFIVKEKTMEEPHPPCVISSQHSKWVYYGTELVRCRIIPTPQANTEILAETPCPLCVVF